MSAKAAALCLLSLACCTVAAPSYAGSAQVMLSSNPNEPQVGWYDPRDHGGRLLDVCFQLPFQFYLKYPVYDRD